MPTKAFWLAIFCPLVLAAQAADLPHDFSERVQAALAQSHAPSVSTAVVMDGKLAFAGAFGQADIAAARPATTATRYAVGSISKQFTAAAMLLLQQQGRLSLDDHVAKFFPELTRAHEVTLRQLLSHTAGYEDYAPQDYLIPEWTRPTTTAAILRGWAAKPLNFDPGTRWQYSNTGYVLAAAIIEKVAGQPLVPLLRATIFDPLGMASAGDCNDHSAADASPYTRFALGPPRPVGREAAGWYNGAGELCMTATDVAKWDIAVLQKRILAPASYQAFFTEIKLASGAGTHYALGLQTAERNGVPVLAHSGEVSGFLAYNAIYPTLNGAVVVLSNQDGVNLIGPLSAQLAARAFPALQPAGGADVAEVQAILEGLAHGEIQEGRFTSNARSYFTPTALADIRASLTPLGPLQSVVRSSETLRGGMTHRGYLAKYEHKSLVLNIYVMPDGKYEQFLIEEQL